MLINFDELGLGLNKFPVDVHTKVSVHEITWLSDMPFLFFFVNHRNNRLQVSSTVSLIPASPFFMSAIDS